VDDEFTVVSRKRDCAPNSKAAPLKRTPMIAVRNASALSVVAKKGKSMSLFVSRFGPEVTAQDIKNSLEEQLKLTSLSCTRLKTKFNSYASFHISVNEDDFPLINNTGVWPNDCLIAPFYGRLNDDQIYRPDAPATLLNPNLAGGPAPPISSLRRPELALNATP
jgi:hypothetical protein